LIFPIAFLWFFDPSHPSSAHSSRSTFWGEPFTDQIDESCLNMISLFHSVRRIVSNDLTDSECCVWNTLCWIEFSKLHDCNRRNSRNSPSQNPGSQIRFIIISSGSPRISRAKLGYLPF
jgi:hypothetical protein